MRAVQDMVLLKKYNVPTDMVLVRLPRLRSYKCQALRTQAGESSALVLSSCRCRSAHGWSAPSFRLSVSALCSERHAGSVPALPGAGLQPASQPGLHFQPLRAHIAQRVSQGEALLAEQAWGCAEGRKAALAAPGSPRPPPVPARVQQGMAAACHPATPLLLWLSCPQ